MPPRKKTSRKPTKTDADRAEEERQRVHRSRRRRGGLENMPSMPLDILIEIMGHLMPMDLLNLARTSKTFRALLMARSAAPLWKAARRNVEDLPDCPEDLSEPAYANLAFDSHCYECGQAGTKLVLWALRVKFCPQCRREMLTRCANHRGSIFTESCDDLILPYTRADNHTKGHWHLTSDVVKMTEVFDRMSKDDIEKQKQKVAVIMDHAAQCTTWERLAAERRMEEIKSLKEKRLNAVIEKLRSLGEWEDELNRLAPDYKGIRDHWDVDKPQELTERSWKMIKGNLIEHLESLRFDKLMATEKELHAIRARVFTLEFRRWHAKQTDKRALPRPIDLMRRPEIQSILRQPSTATVSIRIFDACRAKFTEWAAEWRRGCEDKLRALIRCSDAFKDKLSDDVDPLSLASVVFTCAECEKNLPESDKMPPLYPSLLSHDCLWPRVTYYTYPDPVERGIVAMSGDYMGFDFREAWDCKPLSIGRWHERAKEVIEVCGKDPYKATLEDMDALDVRLWCASCAGKSVEQRVQVCRWREAFFHYLHHDQMNAKLAKMLKNPGQPIRVKWRVMSGPTVALVKEIETCTDKAWDKFYRIGPYYSCCHCAEAECDYEFMQEHLLIHHQISPATDGSDFYVTPDAEMALSRATLLIKPSRTVEEFDDEEKRFYEQGTAEFCDYVL